MLTTNTQRYGTDLFSFRKQGLLTSGAIDLSTATAFSGFDLGGQQQTGSDRRVCFRVNGVYYKLTITSGAGKLAALTTQTPTVDSLLSEGNTFTELATVTSAPEFLGKVVYTLIGIDASPDATTVPTASIGFKCVRRNDTLTKEDTSGDLLLNGGTTDVTVNSILPTVKVTGSAKAVVTISLRTNNTWSPFVPVDQVRGIKASAIRVKTTYAVTKTDGTDLASVTGMSVNYTV